MTWEERVIAKGKGLHHFPKEDSICLGLDGRGDRSLTRRRMHLYKGEQARLPVFGDTLWAAINHAILSSTPWINQLKCLFFPVGYTEKLGTRISYRNEGVQHHLRYSCISCLACSFCFRKTKISCACDIPVSLWLVSGQSKIIWYLILNKVIEFWAPILK